LKMARVALVDKDGNVKNVIVLEDGVEWLPPDDVTTVVDVEDKAEKGGTYDKSLGFAPPPLPTISIPEVTIEQLQAALIKKGIITAQEVEAEKIEAASVAAKS
jgi:hypothetical protein